MDLSIGVLLSNAICLMICFAVPLLLVALGGMYSERSGVINLALEGIMIIGALCACIALKYMNEPTIEMTKMVARGKTMVETTVMVGWGEVHPTAAVLIAVAVAAVSGVLFSLFLAFAAINLKADQTIGGTALNQFAPAFAVVLAWSLQEGAGRDIMIPNWVRILPEKMGISGTVNQDFLPTLFKQFYLTTPIAIVLFVIATVVLYKTRFGLRLRACGEHPQAADSVGINVYKMRYAGVMISGLLAGVGGFAYVIAAGSSFSATVGGYGFLALAVMIFGAWKPFRILLCAMFFALFRVVATQYTLFPFLDFTEQFERAGITAKIGNLYNMIPYIVTMIVLILTSKNSRAPKAEGIPYDKGQR